jgi:hypothetical protein
MDVRTTRERLKKEEGVAAVEFAIVMTLLFMLIFGIIEFSIVYSQYQVFQGAAREGARHAAVRDSQSAIEAAVEASVGDYDLPPGWLPTITVDGATASDPPCGSNTVGKTVIVSWAQPFSADIPFFKSFTKTITIQGVFRCE